MKIVIAIATRGNDLYYRLNEFINHQVKKYDCAIVYGECGYSAEVAQGLLFDKVTKIAFDYCLLLDTDVAPPLDALDKLLACNKPVVSAPTWHYDPMTKDVHLNIHYAKDGEGELERVYHQKESGIDEIVSTSFACLLINASVFNAFYRRKEEFFRWSELIGDYDKWHGKPSDNIFYAKIIAMGIKIYTCWDVKNVKHNRHVILDDETLGNIIKRVKV